MAVPPQRQVFGLMQNNPKRFMSGIRVGMPTHHDDLAWESTLDGHF
jgi:hypothetical protein